MSIQDKIVKLFKDFGKRCSADLKDGAKKALALAGRKNPQDISLSFNEKIKLTPNGNVIVDIVAVDKAGKSAKYWKAIEEGRKAGKKPPPSNVVGKKWQQSNNIDPRVVLLQMQPKRKGLKVRKKKSLNFDKAAKSLSFIIARSIGKKGIKPKPYVNKVLNDGRIQKLKADLAPLLGEQFKLVITGNLEI